MYNRRGIPGVYNRERYTRGVQERRETMRRVSSIPWEERENYAQSLSSFFEKRTVTMRRVFPL